MTVFGSVRGALLAASVLVSPSAFAQAPQARQPVPETVIPPMAKANMDRAFQAVAVDLAAHDCAKARVDLNVVNAWLSAAEINIRTDQRHPGPVQEIQRQAEAALRGLASCDVGTSASDYHAQYMAREAARAAAAAAPRPNGPR